MPSSKLGGKADKRCLEQCSGRNSDLLITAPFYLRRIFVAVGAINWAPVLFASYHTSSKEKSAISILLERCQEEGTWRALSAAGEKNSLVSMEQRALSLRWCCPCWHEVLADSLNSSIQVTLTARGGRFCSVLMKMSESGPQGINALSKKELFYNLFPRTCLEAYICSWFLSQNQAKASSPSPEDASVPRLLEVQLQIQT